MIKSCVIGLSKIGLIHCDTLIKLKNTQLTHVYDSNSKLRTKYAKQFKCNTSKNFNEILNKKDISLFVIASPTTTHEFYINKLINRKKMIYCEKPILMNSKKLKSLTKKIRGKKIRFCIGLNRRFSKGYLKMKKLSKNKSIKRIKIISKSSNWDAKLSSRNGGLFADKGFHFFDLACWFGASKPKELIVTQALSSKEYLKQNDYSEAVVQMKLKNNIFVKFIFSRYSQSGNIEQIKLYGSNININSDKFFNKKILSKDFSIKFRDSYHECLKSFINKNKRTQLFEEGIEAQLISDAALKSAKSDKKLKLLNKI